MRLGDLVAGRLTDRRDTVLLGQVFWGWRVAKLGAIRSEDGVVRAVEVFHRDVARTGDGGRADRLTGARLDRTKGAK